MVFLSFSKNGELFRKWGFLRGVKNRGYFRGVKNRGILGEKGENPENQQNRGFWGILPNS